jgi:hypothetical protein
MDKPNVAEDNEETVKVIYFMHHNELSSDFGEPKTFKEAWNGTEPEKWKPSMGSEVMNFLNRKAWTKIKRDKTEKTGKKILKVKWVFKKKDEQDGSIRYKLRIVTKGYLQIPGVDYTESIATSHNRHNDLSIANDHFIQARRRLDSRGYCKYDVQHVCHLLPCQSEAQGTRLSIYLATTTHIQPLSLHSFFWTIFLSSRYMPAILMTSCRSHNPSAMLIKCISSSFSHQCVFPSKNSPL